MADLTDNLVSKPWLKFLAKFTQIKTLPLPEWKEVHLLAFFCQRFEILYQKKFALSFRGAPSKCTEIYMIKRTMAMLDTTNPEIIHNYINWIFEKKIIPQKLKIRTIGFLTTPGFGNEFQNFQEESNKIIRSTQLPESYVRIAQNLDIQISTYGELAFIKMALDQTPSRTSYKTLLDNLIQIGFKPLILNSLV